MESEQCLEIHNAYHVVVDIILLFCPLSQVSPTLFVSWLCYRLQVLSNHFTDIYYCRFILILLAIICIEPGAF